MSESRKIRRALVSVSDKAGVVEFATDLARMGVKIISTGGTAATLRDSGLEVTDVADITGFPEMMGGRVKTLHPKIHGAFLALRDEAEHRRSMDEHGIEAIDLVVVNLYPFEQTIEMEGVSLEEAVENIDIGGPAMIRSAAKNWRDVAIVTDPRYYDAIIEEMIENGGCLSIQTRRMLATLAYTRTASYDLAISSYLAGHLTENELSMIEPLNPLGHLAFINPSDTSDDPGDKGPVPPYRTIELEKVRDLRYGENPHQRAALYYADGDTDGIASAEQLHGKEMSFNNYVDADAAWDLVNDIDQNAVAIIKHTNPAGVGTGGSGAEAYRRALATDPVSAFGGIVAFNRPVDAHAAKCLIEIFFEVIIAPDFDDDALDILRAKKNLRVLKCSVDSRTAERGEVKQIGGGFLLQDKDIRRLDLADVNVVTERTPTDAELAAMRFAWIICKHVRSNAIVFANEYQTLGVGAGQMNRVDSVRIAAMRADRFGHRLEGCALASDAFFPFRDNVDEAAKFGVSAIIQPGGSLKDSESIAAANEHKIAMALTGIRHFKH